MQPTSALTRRHVLGGMGAIVATTATGLGTAPAQALGPVTLLTLGSVDFRPATSTTTFATAGTGGIQATAGNDVFVTGLRLPAGSRIFDVWFYLNPNGSQRNVFLTRYRPLNRTFDTLTQDTSTAGTAVESVHLSVTHDLHQNWNYRLIAWLGSGAGGAILYGARVRYRPPV